MRNGITRPEYPSRFQSLPTGSAVHTAQRSRSKYSPLSRSDDWSYRPNSWRIWKARREMVIQMVHGKASTFGLDWAWLLHNVGIDGERHLALVSSSNAPRIFVDRRARLNRARVASDGSQDLIGSQPRGKHRRDRYGLMNGGGGMLSIKPSCVRRPNQEQIARDGTQGCGPLNRQAPAKESQYDDHTIDRDERTSWTASQPCQDRKQY